MATITPVNVGAAPNDDTGDPLRDAFIQINANEAALNTEVTTATSDIANLGALSALNTVGAAQIDALAVTTAKIADDAVTQPKIGPAAVGTTELADDGVTQPKIGAGAVGTTELAATGVTEAKIADGAVTRAKLGSRSINAQTGTAFTVGLTDENAVVTMNNAAANTLTIPANATTAFPVGSQIDVIQIGAGATTIDAAVGVTLNGVSGGSGALTAQYSPVTLLKTATDTWLVFGDIEAVA